MMTDKKRLKGKTECPMYGKAIEENPHWCKVCGIGTDGTAICPFRKYECEVIEHQEVCESLRKWANVIAREELYSDLQVYKVDLKDGKITYQFSLTPKVR